MDEANKPNNILQKKPVVINVGLDLFFQALEEQKAEVIRVEWKPYFTNNDPEILNILDQLL